ncbi:hypothetical protein QYF36_015570 [Acer negundo]|nr:hypothetical protein QYF36_015570 [Acer negundo]
MICSSAESLSCCSSVWQKLLSDFVNLFQQKPFNIVVFLAAGSAGQLLFGLQALSTISITSCHRTLFFFERSAMKCWALVDNHCSMAGIRKPETGLVA